MWNDRERLSAWFYQANRLSVLLRSLDVARSAATSYRAIMWLRKLNPDRTSLNIHLTASAGRVVPSTVGRIICGKIVAEIGTSTGLIP
jgi:hypothetical protein